MSKLLMVIEDSNLPDVDRAAMGRRCIKHINEATKEWLFSDKKDVLVLYLARGMKLKVYQAGPLEELPEIEVRYQEAEPK